VWIVTDFLSTGKVKDVMDKLLNCLKLAIYDRAKVFNSIDYYFVHLESIIAPTDPKIGADLMANSLVYGRGNIDERTVTICSGIDFVQIGHTNITGADPATAKV
jgi:hypothetical protein